MKNDGKWLKNVGEMSSCMILAFDDTFLSICRREAFGNWDCLLDIVEN